MGTNEELTRAERAAADQLAWDRFAASALEGIIVAFGQAINTDTAALDAAVVADKLMAERAKRPKP